MRIPAAALLALLSIPTAHADALVTPSALAPALGVYVDGLIADRGAAMGCSKPDSPGRDDAAWARAKAVFVASLWANGFAGDFVKEMTARFDAPPPAAKVDCASADTQSELAVIENNGWDKEVARVFLSMGMTPIAVPVSPQQWQAVRDSVTADLPAQKRLFECVAVSMPSLMPVVVHDWDEMLGKTAARLVAAGLPHDEITAVIGSAEANALWHRTPAEAVAALTASCARDEAWSRRVYNLEFLSLGSDVDKLLPPVPDDN